MNAPTTRHPIDSNKAVWFEPDACVELRPASARCGHCRDSCARSAFDWKDGGVRVTEDCVGCGRCSAACPTGALAVHGFSFSKPSDRLQVADIECRRVPVSLLEPGAQVVPCLGGISSNDLLSLVASGYGDVELIDRGWCGECPAGGGGRCVVQGAVEASQRVFEELGLPLSRAPRIRYRPLSHTHASPMAPRLSLSGQDQTPLARRALFGALLRRSAEMAAPRMPRIAPTRGACQPSPVIASRRQRRAETLIALAQQAERPLSERFFPTLEASTACSHHTVCAATCPSGALGVFEQDDGSVGLNFDPERCLACGLCVGHCPEGALRLSPFGNGDAVHVRGRRTLVRHRPEACPQCGNAFIAKASEAVCPNCRRNRDMAAGLFGTASAQR